MKLDDFFYLLNFLEDKEFYLFLNIRFLNLVQFLNFVLHTKDYNSLINYRQAIIDKIVKNNYELMYLKECKEKQENINVWLFKMYYFLNIFN